jgi:SAM-dependent methyltransferase
MEFNGFASSRDYDRARFQTLMAELVSRSAIGLDACNHWSRKWEFIWAYDGIISFAAQNCRAGLTAIESGSGLTPVPIWITNKGISVTGVDLDQRYANDWREVVPLPSKFMVGDMLSLPVADDSFDIAYSVSALEHTTDPVKAVRELIRVCKPDGMILFTCDVAIAGNHGLSTEQMDGINALVRELKPFSPSRWLSPRDILTFKSAIHPSLNPVRRITKDAVIRLGLKSDLDFAIFAFRGSKPPR